jgi:hypothetical protein
VLRAREEFLRLFFDGTFENDADKIERYFMDYAFAARYEHARTPCFEDTHETLANQKKLYHSLCWK